MPASSRDEAEAALAVVVSQSTRTYLQQVLEAVREALRTGRFDRAQPLLALGVLMNWWTDSVGDSVVESIRESWQAAFGVTAQGVTTPRADAMAFHIAAVRDRLSRSAQPEIPEGAFDQIRLSQSVGALEGRSIDEMSRDIAERLAWEPDKAYWKAQKQLAEDKIDEILDPLGKPGTPSRTIAHQTDPGVKIWQTVRAEAVERINADESYWQVRAERIARTEATSAWNSGSLAALADEGVTHKEWLSHIDDRTRDSHREADGQVVAMTKPFRVGKSLLMMPGDPSAPPWETVNCRCTVIGATTPEPAMITASIMEWLGKFGRPGEDYSTTVCVMAIPAVDSEVHDINPDEEKHTTLLYFGDIEEHEDSERLQGAKQLFLNVLNTMATEVQPFMADVTGIEGLGGDEPQAQVWLLDSPELHKMFNEIPEIDSEIQSLYDGADVTHYPEYKPHVTIGYGVDPEEAKAVKKIAFDRISLWWGEEHIDIPLGQPALMVASGWQDQLRIPQGNGERSGRWTFTPWKHLDDLVGLLNALGPDSEPSTRATIKEALDALVPFDPSNMDPHDEAFQEAVSRVADILDRAAPTGDESLNDALMQAAAGVREFADADWSLFAEETDIGYEPPSSGRAGKQAVWEGDLPTDVAVNPDLEGKTSKELADELQRIKDHPVAPSPSARRKRATYLKELQDRRDRDQQTEPKTPDPDVQPENIFIMRHPDAKQPTRATRDGKKYTITLPDGTVINRNSTREMTHVLVRRNGAGGTNGNGYFYSLASSEDKALREANVYKQHRTHIEIAPIVSATSEPIPDPNDLPGQDAPTIEAVGHNYGTASVDVAPGFHYSGTSREASTPYDVEVVSYYVEDEDDYGYKNKVTVVGRPLKKDGTPSSRQVRLDIASNDVPDNVWRELVKMRPDLTRSKDDTPSEPDKPAGLRFDVDLSETQQRVLTSAVADIQAAIPGTITPSVTDGAGADILATVGGWPTPYIRLGKVWSDEEALSKAWEGAKGLSIPGQADSPEEYRRRVVVHEMGHLIQRQVEDVSDDAAAEVLAFTDEPVKWTDATGQERESPRFKIDNLDSSQGSSFYGNETRREWFAEAIADGVLNGDKASESGKRAVALARKHLSTSDATPGVSEPEISDETATRHAQLREALQGARTVVDIDKTLARIIEDKDLPDLARDPLEQMQREYLHGTFRHSNSEVPWLTRVMQDLDQDDPWKDTLDLLLGKATNEWPRIQERHRRVTEARKNLIGYMQGLDQLRTDTTPSVARDWLMGRFAAFRGELADQLSMGVLTDADALAQIGDGQMINARQGLKENDWTRYETAIRNLVNLTKDREEGDKWKALFAKLDRESDRWHKYFADDPEWHSPEFDRILKALPEAETAEDLRVLVNDLIQLENEAFREGVRSPFGSYTLGTLAMALKNGDTAKVQDYLDNQIIPYLDTPAAGPWQPFAPVFKEISEWHAEAMAAEAQRTHMELEQKHGTIPEELRTPQAIVSDVGMFYGTRTSGTSNCVLASTVYELRRRGIDAHPQRAEKGRHSDSAQRKWFVFPSDSLSTSSYVEGLKGTRKANRYKKIVEHIQANHPPGSRGTISGGWKGLSYGHIWNWEVEEDGSVVFWDPQPGIQVTADSDYWQEIDYKYLRVARLDHLDLKPDIDVVTADPEYTKKITPEMQMAGATLAVMKGQVRGLYEQLRKLDYWSQKDQYSEIMAKINVINGKIAEVKESPAGKALAALGNSFPVLPPDKNTL